MWNFKQNVHIDMCIVIKELPLTCVTLNYTTVTRFARFTISHVGSEHVAIVWV